MREGREKKKKNLVAEKEESFGKRKKKKRIPIIMSPNISYFLVFTIVIPLISDYFNLSSSLVLETNVQ